ncbi:hypothetical protein KVR01_000475 [Diaporthe batatas]|uniref:uncharacterized protein n=1 Tax=Diaporthe batatas TaxID=748121 RepID=UPI001D036CDC|nr:uncharacterized protein KVR01_000475 [Diaporthe batatas]KAG8169730.1 hypothetical protein KVR01_000475 [Diaporthe batatas]
MDMLGVKATALLAGSFLSGTMASLSLIAVPVFMDTTGDATQLVHQWARMYEYGHKAMPTISVGVCILHVYMAASKKRRGDLDRGRRVFSALAGVSTVLMLPFTWLFMVPTNNELFRLEALSRMESPGAFDLRGADVKGLVGHWAELHAIRCIFPLAGAVLGMFGTS